MTTQQGVVAAYWPFPSVADPDDSAYAPRGPASVKISDALGRIVSDGSGLFAFGGTADCLLPALPGLVVRDAGVIPIPLAEGFARVLLDRCTRCEDAARWELPADRLWMKNPEWNSRVADLGVAVGKKLGFQAALLDVLLSKLVVYGPGARLTRRKDEEHEEDVVATMEVQLPSLHEGGDLLVFDDEDEAKKYRFNFGEIEGAAAFRPSYAVYVAGAEYELEEVQKGYRVVLEYSIRLPSDETPNGVDRSRRFVQKELKQAVEQFGATNETFALLLSNANREYDAFEMQRPNRLTGVNQARFQALKKANRLIPADKKIKFYLAKLEHTAKVVKDLGDGDRALLRSFPLVPAKSQGARWRVKGSSDSVEWLSASGEMLQNWNRECANDTLNWTKQFNFLNTDGVSPRAMWSKHITQDELVVEKTIKYKAYALVGWPVAHDLENTASLIGEDAALSLVLTDEVVSASKLRAFMNMATGKERDTDDQRDSNMSSYMAFCQRMCRAITAVGDVELVWLFFIRFFDKLMKKGQLAPSIADLIKKFGWVVVRLPLANAIKRLSPGDAMKFSLEVVSACATGGNVPVALVAVAVNNAQLIPAAELASSDQVCALWRAAVNSQDTELFARVLAMLKNLDPSALGPVISAISNCVQVASPSYQRASLASLVSARCHWLEAEVARFTKSLTLEISRDRFQVPGGIDGFLCGPHHSALISGFADIVAARKFINETLPRPTASKPIAPLTMLAEENGARSLVLVKKTTEQVETANMQLEGYVTELKHLSESLGPALEISVSGVGEKRPSPDNDDDHDNRSRQRLDAPS
jgi:hypothetical protein